MAQKTAVKWLEDNLIGNPHFEEDFIHNRNVFEQAKQMEKEQIEKAYTEGVFSELEWRNAEQYYNELYK